MDKKVILILVDGMRPDGIAQCGNPYLPELARRGASTMSARCVMPSVTLPCHTSLFFSAPPERHGILTNTWNPMVRPIESLFDVIAACGGKCASFYNWEQLRDLSHPGALACNYYVSLHAQPKTDDLLTDAAISYISGQNPDFVFLYLGITDEVGHGHGWMSEEYLGAIANASACIERVVKAVGDRYTVLVTADHGGHGRGHGADIPEDMTIPMICVGADFAPQSELTDATIMDLAPTVVKVMGVRTPDYWEGKPLI